MYTVRRLDDGWNRGRIGSYCGTYHDEGMPTIPSPRSFKIPLPLANNEVEAVSRRARDRWYQQDSNTVAAASIHPGSSRSSSPTNETVYAGGTRHSGSSPVPPPRIDTARDALDHQIRCNNCNEWIMGKRYQCANCPSDPVAYNLVSKPRLFAAFCLS